MSRIYLPGKQVAVSDVIQAVCEEYGFTEAQMRQKTRGTMQLAFARQVAMYVAYETCNTSGADIGQEFGGRDHSTVVHARKVVAQCLVRPRVEAPKQEKDRLALLALIGKIVGKLNEKS